MRLGIGTNTDLFLRQVGIQPAYEGELLTSFPTDWDFSRNSEATVKDWEGVVKTALANEVRFGGARRVENLLSYSEDLTNAAWSKNGTTTIDDVDTVSFDAGSVSSKYVRQVVTVAERQHRTYNWIVEIPPASAFTDPTAQIGIRFFINEILVTPTSEVQRIVVQDTPTSSNTIMNATIWATKDTTVVGLKKFMFEEVTGQSNQNPSEYVSANVLSGNYHGAGVDGVKYFDYENGNTVSSGVITEAQGTALSPFSDSGTMKGYKVEEQATNLLTESQDLSSLSVIGTLVFTQLNVGSPVESEDAYTIEDDDGAGLEYISQAVTVADDAVTRIASIFIKKVGSTPSHYPVLGLLFDGGTPVDGRVIIDNENGVLYDETGSAPDFSHIEDGFLDKDGNEWCRVVVGLANNSSGNTNCKIQIFPAGAANLGGSLSSAATGANDFAGAMIEQKVSITNASSYITTSGGTATRLADEMDIPSFSTTNFTAVIGIIPVVDGDEYVATYGRFIGSDDAAGANNEIRTDFSSYDFTPTSGAGAFSYLATDMTKDTFTKISLSLKQEGADARAIITKDGVSEVNETNTQTLDHSDANYELGYWSNTGEHFNGFISDVKLYNKGLTESKQESLTTL